MRSSGKFRIPALCCAAALAAASSPVMAQVLPPEADPDPAATRVAADSPFHSRYRVALGVGLISYEDTFARDAEDLYFGIELNLNIADLLLRDDPNFHIGIRTGAMSSILSEPDTGEVVEFRGGAEAFESSTLVLVPLNIQAGGSVLDERLFLAAHGGANLLFLSNGVAMNLGRGAVGDENATEIFPNLGGTIGWSFSRLIGASIQGDLTFVPARDIFTGTVNLSFGFG